METQPSFLVFVLVLVLSIGIVHQLFGMAWYSERAFGPAWRRLTGVTSAQAQDKKNMWVAIVGSFVVACLTGFVLAFTSSLVAQLVFWNMPPILATFLAVLSLWAGLMFLPQITIQLYKKQPWKLFWIENGFNLLFALAVGALMLIVPALMA
jgi:hypothetical protein